MFCDEIEGYIMTTVISMCMNLTLALFNGVDCTDIPSSPPPPLDDLAVFVTVYDTALCEVETACLQGNGDGYFASMTPVSAEWYGRMAACPPQLFGATIQLLDMDLYCGDMFGSLNGRPVDTLVYHPEFGWSMRVDVFWPVADEGHPHWNAWYISEWDRSWEININ
jgi:hypothetical protein